MAFVPPRRHGRGLSFVTNIFSKEASGICATCAIIVIGVFFVISLLALSLQTDPPAINVVYIDADAPPLFRTSPYFVSLALDSSVIAEGFHTFNPTDPRFINMMSYLGPCYLRIGGTMADRLIFSPNNHMSFKTVIPIDSDGGSFANDDFYAKSTRFPNFTMSGKEWLQLNQMAIQADMVIIFDLNCMLRHPDGSWHYQNAEELIKFSSDHNLNVIWELGNEPNSFKHVFNYEVNATQLARDFIKLRQILSKYPKYKNSLIVGPDVTRPKPVGEDSEEYLNEFLHNVNHTINAVTWHQYYMNGRTAGIYDFLNPAVFNLFEEQIAIVKNIVAKNGYDDLPIWLGETSSAYGGGAPGYSNRYISTFIWLDKLGVAARSGIDLVVRQSIYKGFYALLSERYEPNPDWWMTVLYKSFVGPEVIPCYTAANPKVRLYCHCTSNSDIYKVGNAITIFGINMQDKDAKIRIEGLTAKNSKTMPTTFAYIITPNMSILSKVIMLNGQLLYMKMNGDLPAFRPLYYNKVPYFILPPYSLAFFVIPNTNVKACIEPSYFDEM